MNEEIVPGSPNSLGENMAAKLEQLREQWKENQDPFAKAIDLTNGHPKPTDKEGIFMLGFYWLPMTPFDHLGVDLPKGTYKAWNTLNQWDIYWNPEDNTIYETYYIDTEGRRVFRWFTLAGFTTS